MKKEAINKFKCVASWIIGISIGITPKCIELAYEFRGYEAFGGEYLVIPLGVIAALIILQIGKGWDEYIYRKRREERRRQRRVIDLTKQNSQKIEGVKEW